MTEALPNWIRTVALKGHYDVNIFECEKVLRALYSEVEKMADELILSKRQGDMSRRQAQGEAFTAITRELLGPTPANAPNSKSAA